MTTTASDTRTFETELEIQAPIERVWKALTEAEELARWFPVRAETKPGVGGHIRLIWDNHWDNPGEIQIWEPNRRLRTGWASGQKEQGRPVELAVDYHLESRGEGTVLRLVHSGFGRGASWDNEFDGIRGGWAFELRSLRHYLERHSGRQRQILWLSSGARAEPLDQMWSQLVGALQLEALSNLTSFKEGADYAFQSGAGDRFEGKVVVAHDKRQFAGTVRGLDDGMFRVEVYPEGTGSCAIVWMSLWGDDASPLASYETRWRPVIEALGSH